MKVAIYARVSTDDKGQDPLNQLLELREFAARQGWTVVREYTDEATAKNGERTGFRRRAVSKWCIPSPKMCITLLVRSNDSSL